MGNKKTDTGAKTIVLVDDDPFILNLYRKQLERADFNTVSAPDGLAVIDMLPNLSADLIVLDLMLPKVHGLEVLEAIRADSRHKDTPVIILSNVYLPQNAQKAMKAGANKGLLKSECTPAKLIAIIRELINSDPTDAAKKSAHSSSLFHRLLGGGSETDKSVKPKSSQEPDDASSLETSSEPLRAGWRTAVSTIREHCLNYVKAVGSEGARKHLDELYRSVRFLGARASLGDCAKVAQLTGTLEAMLFEQVFKTAGEMSPSAVQTVVQAVDCLDHLFATGKTGSADFPHKPRVLLVDDDAVCNLANEAVLKRANYTTVSTTGGASALTLMGQSVFDLVLLDINMPDMSGFDVCEKLRRIPAYKDTPVLYVTLHGDFQNRARSVLSGANGLITKPIAPLELIVKATTCLLRASEPEIPGHKAAPTGSTSPSGTVGSATLPDQSRATEEQELNPHPNPTASTPESSVAGEKTEVAPQPGAPTADRSEFDSGTKEVQANDNQQALTQLGQELEDARRHLQEETQLRRDLEKAQKHMVRLLRQGETEQAQEDNSTAEQTKLETRTQEARAELADQEKAQQQLRDQLEQARKQLQAAKAAGEQKDKSLKEALEDQTQRREAAEQKAAEASKRHREVEGQLVQKQQAQTQLKSELEKSQKQLRGELEAAQKQLSAQKQESRAEQTKLETRTQEARTELADQEKAQQQLRDQLEQARKQLQAAKAAGEQKDKSLKEALEDQTQRREAAEQKAAEASKRRSELEAQLAERDKAQKQLQQHAQAELEAAQKQLEAEKQSALAEQSKLEAQTKELEAAKAAVEQEVQSLNETLAAETQRRETVEQKVAVAAKRRTELEAQLEGGKQAQVQVRSELEAAQKELAAQKQHSSAEQSKLGVRIKELLSSLADEDRAQQQLLNQVETAQRQLEAQQENFTAEQSRFEAQIKQLKAAKATGEQKLEAVNEALATETQRRETAEQKAASLTKRRSELEAQLTQHQQAQTQLRQQLEQARKESQVQKENFAAEQSRFEAQARDFEAARTAGEQKLEAVNEALATETQRRETAEQKAVSLTKCRSELEAQLAQVRRQIEDETLQRQKLAQRLLEAERTRDELARQADTARELVTTQEEAIRSLDSQVQEHQGQVERLGSLLQSEITQRRQEQATAKRLEEQLAELSDQVAEKVAAEQCWHERESELESSLRRQTELIADAAATAATREAEIHSSQKSIEELRLLQSALCAQVQELTAKHEAASRRIHQLDEQSTKAAQAIEAREQELAALRYAILDAARIGAEFNQERLQVECEAVDGLKRFVGTLLHTPLSMTQRGLVAEISGALEGWRNKRADTAKGVEFQVECPALERSEFNCIEVVESALAAVGKMAEAGGTKVPAGMIGWVPETVQGNAKHLHQLITMLAGSLRDVAGVGHLNLQVSFEAKSKGSPEMQLECHLSSSVSAENLCAHLKTISAASITLPTGPSEASSLTFAAAWQLALAMGGRPRVETTTEEEVCVQIVLPLGHQASLLLPDATTQASVETEGQPIHPFIPNGTLLGDNGSGTGQGNDVHQVSTPVGVNNT